MLERIHCSSTNLNTFFLSLSISVRVRIYLCIDSNAHSFFASRSYQFVSTGPHNYHRIYCLLICWNDKRTTTATDSPFRLVTVNASLVAFGHTSMTYARDASTSFPKSGWHFCSVSSPAFYIKRWIKIAATACCCWLFWHFIFVLLTRLGGRLLFLCSLCLLGETFASAARKQFNTQTHTHTHFLTCALFACFFLFFQSKLLLLLVITMGHTWAHCLNYIMAYRAMCMQSIRVRCFWRISIMTAKDQVIESELSSFNLIFRWGYRLAAAIYTRTCVRSTEAARRGRCAQKRLQPSP